ncbi:MAG: hypothetical protein MJZ26_11400 [Fibrobacter sp.]|nr:hypothetical protein [Fibrobacter sp.]
MEMTLTIEIPDEKATVKTALYYVASCCTGFDSISFEQTILNLKQGKKVLYKNCENGQLYELDSLKDVFDMFLKKGEQHIFRMLFGYSYRSNEHIIKEVSFPKMEESDV